MMDKRAPEVGGGAVEAVAQRFLDHLEGSVEQPPDLAGLDEDERRLAERLMASMRTARGMDPKAGPPPLEWLLVGLPPETMARRARAVDDPRSGQVGMRRSNVKGRIFVRQADGSLVPLERAPFDREEELQRLVAEYPDLLGSDQMAREQSRQWLLIDREFGIPGEEDGSARWAADAVFVDQDGVPAVVEVKRSSDTRLRREVVGQLFDYAAHAVVHWLPDRLYEGFVARCHGNGDDPDQVLEAAFGPDVDVERFWNQVRTNIQAGRLCIVLVADEIPAELRRVVEFLNGQMAPAEVFAVEIGHFVGEELATLVPIVLGVTVESEQRRSSSGTRRSWTRSEVLQDITDRCGNEIGAVAATIAEWADGNGFTAGTGTGGSGALVLRFPYAGQDHAMFNMSAGSCKGQVAFGSMSAPFDSIERRQQLADRLNAIDGLQIDDSNLEKGWPTFRLSLLTDQTILDAFLDVWRWYADEIRRFHDG